MKTDQEVMFDPESWPRWPHLPLKKDDSSLFGILVETENGFAFYQSNIWKVVMGRRVLQGHADRGGKELIERLVQEGWIVD